jgi:hypothetical protein
MAKQRKAKTTTTSGKLDAPYVFWAPTESHPSQVSGLFQDNPTFEEFCTIVRQQRVEDCRRANEVIDAMIRKEEEAKQCSSSTPTRSRTTTTCTRPQSQSEYVVVHG